MNSRLARGEAAFCLAANRWGHRSLVRAYFSTVSRLGDGVFWYALMGLIVVFDGYDGLAASAHMAATGAAALFLYRALKRWTKRPRPFASDRRIRPLLHPLDEFSFPSGHTLHAVAFSLVALAHYPQLAALLIPFTVSVGASRVVLGLHYPSDVIAATAIACGIGGFSLWVGGMGWPLA